MKGTIIVFVLGAVLVCGNASFFEHLFNNTRLKGDVRYNTTDGIRVGYDGSLVFDNGYVGVELMKMGANFRAVRKANSKLGNTTNATYDYSGDAHIHQGRHQADVSVNGTLGVKAKHKDNENKTGGEFKAKISNKNDWEVTADGFKAEGKTKSGLHVHGEGCKHKDVIHSALGVHGHMHVEGSVGDGNGNDTSFHISKKVKGGSETKIHVHNETGSNIFGHHFPSVAYEGVAGFKKKEVSKFGDDDNKGVKHKVKAESLFSGLVWAEHSKDNETVSQKVKHVKSADYRYKGKASVHDKGSIHFGGFGTVSRAGGAELNFTDGHKNISGAFGDIGDLHNYGFIKVKPKHDDKIMLDYELEGIKRGGVNKFEHEALQGDNHHHHHKPIKTFLHTRWIAGKEVNAHHTGKDSINVETHGGASWVSDIVDSKSKKPLHIHGDKSYNSTFDIDRVKSTLSNLQIQLGHDNKMIETIASRYANIPERNQHF